MRKITLLLLAFVFVSASAVQAQTKMDEGYIKFEVTDVVSDDPAMAAQLGMMKGTTNEVFFTKERSLTKMNMMGGMMKMQFLANLSEKSSTMFFEAMGTKYMIPMSAEEQEANREKTKATMGDMEFTYDKEDTKEIAGYKCYKMYIKGNGDQAVEMSAYITPDIKAGAEVMQGIEADKIEGFPLEYKVSQGGMFSMVFTAQEIKNEVDTKVFDVDTKGYKEMTMEEFQNAMGQMGGMGF